ncbi:MAG TPA: hypothetical protein VFP84_03390 [Kofleriaceae bacterium]|nr:hypothetical protein [Kofleriaceae bacterium]
MRRQLVVGVLAGLAYVTASARAPRVPSSGLERRGGKFVENDSKRLAPGIHRAKPAELAVRNRVAKAEADKLAARARLRPHAVSAAATTWVSLGPTGARNEFNGVDIAGVDSGRLNAIVVDPRDGNVVYIAASGGGVWKTFDFLTGSQTPAGPTWSPLSDNLPNVAVGALAIDAARPDTLYVGTGDFQDASGNTVTKTIDGGASWGDPVVLAGTYPSGAAAAVSSIRALAVRGDQVLAGTDAGLFASRDGGAHFALVDLPNAGDQILFDSVWSVAATGNGHWVASGVTGCSPDAGPAPLVGSDPDPDACPAGNNGEIWTSPDGVTWTRATQPLTTGVGRITLAAGKASDPATTVVYAYVGATDGSKTVGFWRSDDGGATWHDATGTLANPTLPFGSRADCADTDVGHNQTWYNQMIVVDPTNADNVLVGGNLCGMRTQNGTTASPSWELISHWLPAFDSGDTATGKLPYVHADWHVGLSTVIDGQLRTFAGTDGGIFSSTNVFTPGVAPGAVTWTHHNNGLVTHELYAIGSGDPATGNPFVLFGGLQDNGTRFRVDPAQPSVFNQPIGGDGIGATVHVASSGTTYWGSVEFGQVFCQPSATVDCSDGNNWHDRTPPDSSLAEDDDAAEEARERARKGPDGEDSEPFFIHYANVETDTTGQSVLTHTDNQVWVATGTGTDADPLAWQAISQDFTGSNGSNVNITNVTASRATPGLYGAAGGASIQPFMFTTAGNTPSTWTIAQPVHPTGTAARLTGPSSIDFPPVLPPGTLPGQVFIGAFTNTLNDLARTPPPDDKGHLYRTTDFGQTWTSIVGADPAHRLPNVAVYVVKYDPVTPTTIYAGTDLGVYFTIDDGATWNRMGDGLPLVPVRDLYVAKNQDFIRVATFGRGIWEIYPSATASQGAPGNGDYDRNLRYDWIDLAAMASRLGTSPVTTTPPLYTWIDDLTGAAGAPVQQIDEADLRALLADFGGHP